MADLTILLAHERSGSHLLGEVISSFGNVWVFDEVCNADAIRPDRDPASFHRFRRDWLNANAEAPAGFEPQIRFVDDYFAHLAGLGGGRPTVVQIKYGHIHHFEAMWWPIFRQPFLFGHLERRDIGLIHLWREDVARAAISDQVAKARRLWKVVEGGVDPETLAPVTLDAAAVVEDARLLARQQACISGEWIGGARVYEVTYEGLVEDLAQGSSFADLAAFVGVQAPLRPGRIRQRRTLPSIANGVANFEEVRGACIEAGLRDPAAPPAAP